MTGKAKLLLLALLATAAISCDQARREGKQVADELKEEARKKLEEQTQKVADKILPPFDHDKPDTENNKQRFRDFIKVEITPDVKNIYCFDDAIGIDASYMFAFNCDPATSRKIIEINNLSIDTSDGVFGPQYDFEWWDEKRIAQLQRYSWTDGQQYHKYYWYDPKENKVYFFDFDM